MSTHRPRVLIVTTWLPSKVSPLTGNFVARDIATLSAIADVRVIHLVSPALDDGQRDFIMSGVSVKRVVMDLKNPLSIVRARKHVQRAAKRADVVHTMAVSSAIAVVGQSLPCPWVHTEHWSGFLAWNSGWQKKARQLFASFIARATRVVAVSDLLGNAMTDILGRKVTVIPNQVDAACMPRPRSGQDLLAKRDIRMVAVGNLVESKRPGLAVDTVAELNCRGWRASLTWYGDGPLREDLCADVQSRGIDVTFPGAIAPEAVAAAVAANDLFILPTEYETFCLAAAEALSVGRPVVMGAQGGQRAFVTPQVGALVEGHSPQDYADSVESLVQATADLVAEDFGEHIRARYAPSVFAAHYARLYREVISQPLA